MFTRPPTPERRRLAGRSAWLAGALVASVAFHVFVFGGLARHPARPRPGALERTARSSASGEAPGWVELIPTDVRPTQMPPSVHRARPRAKPPSPTPMAEVPPSLPVASRADRVPSVLPDAKDRALELGASAAAPGAADEGTAGGEGTVGDPPARLGGTAPTGSGLGTVSSGPDVEALERHLARAAAAACYPRAAARRGQRGEVRIRFCATPTREAADVSVEASSGVLGLDRAAVECVLARAAPLPVQAGCYAVRIRFGLP